MPEPESKNELELYLRDGNITTIRSPVRLKIVRLLQKNGSATFPEIQEETGLSKSTVSVYLNSLVDGGIVSRVSGEYDRRHKSYVLSAKYIGTLAPSTYSAASWFRELIRNTYTNYDKISYKAMLPHIFRIALAESGISIDPVLKRGGIILGESIVPFIVAETLEDTVANLSEFWARYEFGEMSLKSREPFVLEVKNCYECMTLPKGIPGGCVITTGILDAVFSAHFGSQAQVRELSCLSLGDPSCCFEIAEPGKVKA